MTPSPALNGQAILDGLKNGEETAINELFRTYFAPLCGVAHRIVQDEAVAKDIVQEVFVRLWTHRRTLRIQQSLMGYLRRSVVNAAIDHGRRHYEQKKASLANAPKEQLASSLHADDQTKNADLARLVEVAVSQLPERCRLVFVLSRHEELSYKEIAQRLDISVKTVENQMSKALKMLRQALQGLLSMLVFFFGKM